MAAARPLLVFSDSLTTIKGKGAANMNEPKKPRPSWQRKGRWFLVVGLTGIVILLIALAPTFHRWNREAFLRSRISRVQEDDTLGIMGLKADLVEYLLQNAEWVEKTSDVWIYDSNEDVSDVRFRSLKQLPHLKSICLEYCGCVDVFLKNIQGMVSLEKLTLHRAGVSKNGIPWLLSFPKLKRLSIDRGPDPACFDALKGRAGIESLELCGDRITADQLKVLATLPNLRELTLSLELEEHDVLDLHGLPRLEMLDINSSIATDATLASLQGMKSLAALSLCGDKITDAGLKHLKGLTCLKKLDLRSTKVSDQGVKELQRALPNCKIKN
jgi:hypothetical protein